MFEVIDYNTNMQMSSYKFSNEELENAPLVIDATYEGTEISNEPLHKLMRCGNMGGFRPVGRKNEGYNYIVIYSLMNDPDWPDEIDIYNGTVTYFGDNKKPGKELHDTKVGGNSILRKIFDDLHNDRKGEIPPIFLFTKGAKGRDVIFRGLLVPGASNLSEHEDLVAIWKSDSDSRFQNYKAIFSILDEGNINNSWLSDLRLGVKNSIHEPEQWIKWKNGHAYSILQSEKSISFRSIKEQLPEQKLHKELVHQIYEFASDDSYLFENVAANIFKLADSHVVSWDLTRRSRDGGRDAIGKYFIGDEKNGVSVDFSLEAKCYSFSNGVGVKEISRLISRLRHRQFGVLVTTSYIGEQVQKELIEDGHPIVLISARDIAEILLRNGINNTQSLQRWLHQISDT